MEKHLDLHFTENGGESLIKYNLNCEEGSTFTLSNPSGGWVTVSEPSNGEFTITVYEQPEGGEERNVKLKAIINGSKNECEEIYIYIEQDGKAIAPCSCNPDNFRYGEEVVSRLEWGNTDTSDKTITYAPKDNCLVVSTQTNIDGDDANSFTVDVATTGEIKVHPVGEGGNNGKNAALHIKYSANGKNCEEDVNVTLTQKGIDCGCDDFTLGDESMVWKSDESGVDKHKFKTFTTGVCIDTNSIEVETEQNSHFTAKKVENENKIEVYPNAVGTSTKIEETIIVKYKLNGHTDYCPIKTFVVTHEGSDCDCKIYKFYLNDNIITGDLSVYFDSEDEGPSSAKIVTIKIDDGKESCFQSVDINFDNSNGYFNFEKLENNAVKVYPLAKNGSLTTDKTAGIKYNFIIGGIECPEDVINVKQIPGCKCNSIFSNVCSTPNEQSQYSITIPNEAGSYIIGSGNTNGCGSFTYDPKKLIGTNVTSITFKGTGYNREFEIETKKNSGTTDSGNTVTILFKKELNVITGQQPIIIGECSRVFNVIQSKHWVSCDRWKKVNFSSTIKIAYTQNDRKQILNWSSNDTARALVAFYRQGILKNDGVSTSTGWLHNLEIETGITTVYGTEYEHFYVYAKVDMNPGRNPRQGSVTFSLDANAASRLGICNCNITKSFNVEQSGNTSESCNCQENNVSAFKHTLSFDTKKSEGQSGESEAYVHMYNGTCLGSPKFTLTYDEAGNRAITDSDSDVWTLITGLTDNWLKVKVAAKESSSKYNIYLKWQYKKNTATTERKATYYLKVNLLSGVKCIRKIEVTQEANKEIDCQALYDSIEGPWPYLSFTPESHTNAVIAHTDESLVEDSNLVVSTNQLPSWISGVDNTSGKRNVYATISSNISNYNDGAKDSRTGTIYAYFVDSNGQYIKIGGKECKETKTITVTQKGFSGYCPDCQSLSINDLEIIYKKENGEYYGEISEGCHNREGMGPFPAFHGGQGEKELFKCRINKKTTINYLNKDVRCFDVIAKANSSHISWVKAELIESETDENKATYMIKGTIVTNTSGNQYGANVDLSIGRWNYIENELEECTPIKDGIIIVMDKNQTECQF